MIHDDSDTPDYGGMTLRQIEHKHRRLRGTDDLKYPPTRRERCQTMCGHDDLVEGRGGNEQYSSHQCFRAPFVPHEHEFSSECAAMHVKEVGQ